MPLAVQAPPLSKTHLEIEQTPACQKLPTEMTDSERKLLRQQRFLNSDCTTLAAAKQKILEDKEKRLQRAKRFGVSVPELE